MKYAMLSGIILGLASTPAFGEPVALGDRDLDAVTGGVLDVGPVNVNVPEIDFKTLQSPSVTTIISTPTNTSVLLQISHILNLLNEGAFEADVVQMPTIGQEAPVGDQ